jgi:hypothetical protein
VVLLRSAIPERGAIVREQGRGRFFVTITAADKRRMQELAGWDLDLFASRSDDAGHHVDGLITLEEVGKLVEAGYLVLVAETDRPKRKHEFIGFEEWRSEMLADLERDEKKER